MIDKPITNFSDYCQCVIFDSKGQKRARINDLRKRDIALLKRYERQYREEWNKDRVRKQ